MLERRIKQGKTSRRETVKLFEKTSTYIRSLKDVIEEKELQVRELEKELKCARSASLGQMSEGCHGSG